MLFIWFQLWHDSIGEMTHQWHDYARSMLHPCLTYNQPIYKSNKHMLLIIEHLIYMNHITLNIYDNKKRKKVFFHWNKPILYLISAIKNSHLMVSHTWIHWCMGTVTILYSHAWSSLWVNYHTLIIMPITPHS